MASFDDDLRQAAGNFQIVRPSVRIDRLGLGRVGPNAVECAVMLSLVIVVCLTAIQAVGTLLTADEFGHTGRFPVISVSVRRIHTCRVA